MCILDTMATRTDTVNRALALRSAAAWVAPILIALALITAAAQVAHTQAPDVSAKPVSTAKPDKADVKKAKTTYEQGIQAERQQDWDAAYTAYTDASNLVPSNREYALRREIAKSRLVQSKVDAAERDAISGRMDDARKQLLSASFLDPLNPAVRARLAELAIAEAADLPKPPVAELSGEPRLEYQTGTRNFDYRGDTQGAYEELGRQFGLQVAFDVDLHSRQIRFHYDDLDFPTAARLLGDMTGTFWRALTPRLFFVTENSPQKRKDYDASVVRTVLLPASETPEQMTEMTRMVREVAGITRADLDVHARTLTLRSSPQAVALAANLIDDLEQPTGELILEIEILEVDRTASLNLGITPPQSSQVFTVSSQQIQQAAASEEGLIDVIEQVLGTSTPNVIAFGGGATTFFATLPGASANFAQMLSLVRQGRRILLRAQDGQPATFFVGDRIPVSLSTFSPSLLNGSLSSTTGAIANPLVNYATGNSPSFIATSILRANSSIDGTFNDLIVANSADNTVSVLLGNGDGTFANQVVYPLGAATDTDPVWIATGAFDATNNPNIDLAVANKGSNTVSILLGQQDTTGTATGTFTAAADVATGKGPVCVVAADFHDIAATGFLDLAVANQTDDTITIHQGNGDGTFKPPTVVQLPPGYEPTSLATGNFTNSGHTDLVVTEASTVSTNAGLVEILLGNGDGTFSQAPQSPYVVGNTPSFVAIADYNSDGVPDLAIANSGAPSTATDGTAVTGNSVSVLFGNPNPNQVDTGNGTFTTPTAYAAGTGPTSIAVADYNQDGFPDLAMSDSLDNAVTILFNEGTGVFTSSIPEIPVGAGPVSIVTADFNGDGIPDAATADNGAAEATVILNSAALLGALGNGASSEGTPFPGAQYLDIGLKVKATPRIHPDNDVTLDLSFEISSVTAQSYNAIPVISNEAVQQTVRLKENETAMVAGFRETQLSNAITGNPGIADIPGVGLLDQDQNKQNQDTQLLILVTPRLVRIPLRKDHVIYAGPGSLEGPGGGGGEAAPVFVPPPAQQAPPGPAAPPAEPGPTPAPAPAVPAPPPAVPQPAPQQ
jgi:type II secretory pathway component GspD/PulD (secretin)